MRSLGQMGKWSSFQRENSSFSVWLPNEFYQRLLKTIRRAKLSRAEAMLPVLKKWVKEMEKV